MHGDSTPNLQHVCVVCGNPILDTGNRGPAYVAKRKACSQACRAVLTWQKRAKRLSAEPLPKVCLFCGETFSRRSNEFPSAFAKRKTCGYACHNVMINRQRQERLYGELLGKERRCGYCHGMLVQRDGESFAKFMARQTCGPECGAKFMGMNKRVPEELKRGEYTASFRTLRDQIRDRDGHVCRLCGALPGQQAHPVHHIDYDKSNDDERNLITLCRSCHSRTNYRREAWMEFFRDMLEAGS